MPCLASRFTSSRTRAYARVVAEGRFLAGRILGKPASQSDQVSLTLAQRSGGSQDSQSAPNISGCFIPGSGGTLKVVQYADDTTVILRDEASVTNVLSISNLFQQASGAKLNKEKCKGMWLGSLSHKFNTVNSVSFEHTDLKCLGFFGSEVGR